MAQKVQGHQASWENSDAKMAPKTAPFGAVAPKSEKTIYFFFPGRYVAPSRARPLGRSIAGPMPCKGPDREPDPPGDIQDTVSENIATAAEE
ncbi:uncharacterized protein AKAW2_51696A [Aspergillus luchuensis]|uniref:Uncharacterized protein n=1 Tax=Aspergillus kawachii TaxID=1069201 RepID=A0A7R7WEM3_ASPKA|nr:uncharacterized protein AKAW2_51696A [Aspergillus luchuensis]BCS01355.1 hypothetical protein AKAW2_51696A [Aspergillus luchuensis]BCS13099.1 hypothetical protein ALUC_51145A [Aspergillus luchuensis]